MSILKEKLEAAINEWEESHTQQEKQMETTQQQPPAHLFRTTNNVTRSTFNLIRDNAGITRKGAIAKLEEMQYKPASTTSLITQMVRQRLIRLETNGGLHANFPEYMPLKANLRRVLAEKKPKKTKEAKAVPKAEAGIAALQPQAPRSAIITTNFDVDSILKNLTIMQAKALRDALNNLFK